MSAELQMRPPGPILIEVEQAVLGAILTNPEAYHRVAGILAPAHFYEPVHGRIYEAMAAIVARGEPPTINALASMFGADPDLEPVGGGAYFATLPNAVIWIGDCEYQAGELVDAWQRRTVLELMDGYRERFDRLSWIEKAPEAMAGMIAGLQAVSEHATGGQAARLVDWAGIAAQAAQDRSNGQGEPMMSTGLADVDRLLGGGFQAGQLIILAGRPGMGKSSAATWMAFDAARAGRHVGYFSLEMPGAELGQRVLAAVSGAPFQAIRAGERDAVMGLGEALRPLAELRFDIDDTAALTLPDLAARAFALDRRDKLDLLVVDHIGLMRPTAEMRRANKVHQVEEITNGLKALAKRLGCPVLALCQLNRALEGRDDKRPTLADLRDSGAIEQDADVVMFVHRAEYYLKRVTYRGRDQARKEERAADEADARNKADVIVAKNRQGQVGDCEVFCDVATNRWGNLERGYR